MPPDETISTLLRCPLQRRAMSGSEPAVDSRSNKRDRHSNSIITTFTIAAALNILYRHLGPGLGLSSAHTRSWCAALPDKELSESKTSMPAHRWTTKSINFFFPPQKRENAHRTVAWLPITNNSSDPLQRVGFSCWRRKERERGWWGERKRKLLVSVRTFALAGTWKALLKNL